MLVTARASLLVFPSSLLLVLFVYLPAVGLPPPTVWAGLVGSPAILGVGFAMAALVWLNLCIGRPPIALEIADGSLDLSYADGNHRRLAMITRKGILVRDGRSLNYPDPQSLSGGIILPGPRVIPLSREAVEGVLQEAARLEITVRPVRPLGGGPERLRISRPG